MCVLRVFVFPEEVVLNLDSAHNNKGLPYVFMGVGPYLR